MPSLSELQKASWRCGARPNALRRLVAGSGAANRDGSAHRHLPPHHLRQLPQRAGRHVSRRAAAHRRPVFRRRSRRVRPRASIHRAATSMSTAMRLPVISCEVSARRAIAVPAGHGAARMGDGRGRRAGDCDRAPECSCSRRCRRWRPRRLPALRLRARSVVPAGGIVLIPDSAHLERAIRAIDDDHLLVVL